MYKFSLGTYMPTWLMLPNLSLCALAHWNGNMAVYVASALWSSREPVSNTWLQHKK